MGHIQALHYVPSPGITRMKKAKWNEEMKWCISQVTHATAIVGGPGGRAAYSVGLVVRLLGSRVPIPLGTWLFVFVLCCVVLCR
jgi:hypothetical protein